MRIDADQMKLSRNVEVLRLLQKCSRSQDVSTKKVC